MLARTLLENIQQSEIGQPVQLPLIAHFSEDLSIETFWSELNKLLKSKMPSFIEIINLNAICIVDSHSNNKDLKEALKSAFENLLALPVEHIHFAFDENNLRLTKKTLLKYLVPIYSKIDLDVLPILTGSMISSSKFITTFDDLSMSVGATSLSLLLAKANLHVYYQRYHVAFSDFETILKVTEAATFPGYYLSRGLYHAATNENQNAIDDFNYALSLEENFESKIRLQIEIAKILLRSDETHKLLEAKKLLLDTQATAIPYSDSAHSALIPLDKRANLLAAEGLELYKKCKDKSNLASLKAVISALNKAIALSDNISVKALSLHASLYMAFHRNLSNPLAALQRAKKDLELILVSYPSDATTTDFLRKCHQKIGLFGSKTAEKGLIQHNLFPPCNPSSKDAQIISMSSLGTKTAPKCNQ